jgi:hypothetical protein
MASRSRSRSFSRRSESRDSLPAPQVVPVGPTANDPGLPWVPVGQMTVEPMMGGTANIMPTDDPEAPGVHYLPAGPPAPTPTTPVTRPPTPRPVTRLPSQAPAEPTLGSGINPSGTTNFNASVPVGAAMGFMRQGFRSVGPPRFERLLRPTNAEALVAWNVISAADEVSTAGMPVGPVGATNTSSPVGPPVGLPHFSPVGPSSTREFLVRPTNAPSLPLQWHQDYCMPSKLETIQWREENRARGSASELDWCRGICHVCPPHNGQSWDSGVDTSRPCCKARCSMILNHDSDRCLCATLPVPRTSTPGGQPMALGT